jgi:hypothetical protein
MNAQLLKCEYEKLSMTGLTHNQTTTKITIMTQVRLPKEGDPKASTEMTYHDPLHPPNAR